MKKVVRSVKKNPKPGPKSPKGLTVKGETPPKKTAKPVVTRKAGDRFIS